MKKLYATFLLLITAGTTILAQPTYTQASLPSVGTVLTMINVNPSGLVPGNAGANQTWNFGAAAPNGTTSTSYILSPASTPYSASFPGASFVERTTNAAGSSAFVYFSSNASNAEMIGLVDSTTSLLISYSYSNPRRIMNFPFTYNSTFTDASTAFASYMSGSYTINQYRRGTVTFTGDAYGTVTNPAGTFSNTLRTKTVESVTDSILVVGLPVPASIVTTNTVSYSWTGAASFKALFTLTWDTIYSSGGSPTYNFIAGYMDNTSGVNDLGPREKVMTAFPNPGTSTIVHLTADDFSAGETQFIATDMQGREVKHIDFMIFPSAHHSVDVEIADLPAGIYAVRLQQKDAVFSTRFIRQ